MVRVFCDRCGVEIKKEDIIKGEHGVESINSIVIDTIKIHSERDVCEACMKSFDSWWNDTHKVASINFYKQDGTPLIQQMGGIFPGGAVLTEEQIKGVTI